ncbi:MAG TPA: hypothetical protein VF174_09630 [Micromonosporaceae bacterium]
MATGLISAAADTVLGSLGETYTYIQLHTDDPGADGTANVATESTRQQVTWGTPSSGSMASAADLEWTSVAGSEDYTHFSAWTQSSSGSCGFTGTINANAVTTGDTFKIASGGLTVSFTVAS